MNMFSIQIVQFVLVAYVICRFISKPKWRHSLMLVGALIFICMQNAPHRLLNFFFVAMTVAILFIAWEMGRRIERAPEEKKPRLLKRGVWLLVCPLVFFKLIQVVLPPHIFSNFLAVQGNIEMAALAPLGISYFTFRSISYLIEIRRGNIESVAFLKYVNYAVFWPTFMAGPIERPKAFFAQLNVAEKLNNEDLRIGLTRVLMGMVKKLIIGDFFYQIVNPLLLMSSKPVAALQQWNTGQLWICMYAYYFYIYCDFSGYSDVAIGISRIFGYRIMENFRWPILATNIAEFWRRWHISLTGWIRKYVYFGLGGNRKGAKAASRNTIIAMVLVAAWHGLSPHYWVFGFYHAVFLNIYRRIRMKNKGGEAPQTWWRPLLGWLATFQILNMGWPLFLFSIRKAFLIYTKLFGF